ncbi:NADPH-dependent 2,4-dienoyl-CoA reductase, sulfur reductase [Mariprofundus ferrinatatus]|uniref:NADPH-dependent 2,4-dienoyl-CoA reductase, sulfur reductase n=1 Tax=Mariprofundus ferrinatatus TaxID=1921087 RepID=A0A2K8L2R2_9PROT|nr:NAD(P)/FAD-dependent oxidoreductase [Mariprofundus ferrinatatus]ATX81615.1 NADPH-dependent 2,4-dienoyl-CoA reductase, sulfur reductase [Mariprofundus ferrinatatus]
MEHHELIVIGGGPAGLAAATAAAETGVQCLLLDEQGTPGGQIYRAVETIPEERARLLGPDYIYGRKLVDRFNASSATYLPGTSLWSLNSRREIGILRDGQASLMRADRIIIASGAMERPVPFPGWTLPGVMTAGAGQILLKSSGVVPKDGVVLAGVGPLLLLLGWQYLHAGVPIRGILDLSPYGNIWRSLPHLPGALMAHHYILKGLRYQMQLKMAGVKFYGGVSEFHAVGGDVLEAVEFTHRRGRKRIETELLLSHFGVIPDSHLSRCAGCEHYWDHSQLCWRPVTDEWDNSSIEGIAIVGDGSGIGGAVAARHAGRIAGFEAARALGYIDTKQRNEAAGKDQRWMHDDLRVRPFLEARFHPPAELLSGPPDETLVCRCEEVRAGEVRRAMHAGHRDANQVKFLTRCGMGPCQGRQCDNAVSQLVARELGDEKMISGGYRIRPPIRPLTIEQLAGLDVGDASQ